MNTAFREAREKLLANLLRVLVGLAVAGNELGAAHHVELKRTKSSICSW